MSGNAYVFLFRQPDPPSGYYYVVADSLATCMSSCEYIGSMVYMGRVSLLQVGADIDQIPIPKKYGEGFYEPISFVQNFRFPIPPCRRCTERICGKPFESRPLQGMYRGRKLNNYPGRAGEESDDE